MKRFFAFVLLVAGWCGAQCVSNDLGLHADTIIWTDSSHIRAVYAWGSSAQLGDWTATGGSTASIVDGVLNISGGSGNVRGVRWNRHIAATSIRAYVSSATGYVSIYSGIVDTYNGTLWLVTPGIAAEWSVATEELYWMRDSVGTPVSVSAFGTSPAWVTFTTNADTTKVFKVAGAATAYSNILDTSATILIGTAFGSTATIDSIIIDGIITNTSPCAATQYSLTVAASDNGTVNPDGAVSVDSGAGTSIEAIPASGYDFLVWRVISGTAAIVDTNDATTACTLHSGNATVTAIFVHNHFVEHIRRYTNIVHRWSSHIEGGQLVDNVGSNHGAIASGIVQDDSGIQNKIIDYSGQTVIDLDGGINCGDVEFFNDTLKKFTIMGISRITDKLSAGHSLVNKYSGSGDGWKVYITSEGVFNFATTMGLAQFNASEGRWPSDKEVFWALVFDPNGATNEDKVRFFDYGQERTLSYTGTFTRMPITTGVPFRIGHDEYANGFVGTQDEIIIVDSALTREQLQIIGLAARNTKYLLCIGQSNGVVWNNQTPNVVADDNASVLNELEGAFNFIPLLSQTAARSMAPSLCNELSAAIDSGVCLINAAVGGTPICGDDYDSWVYRNPEDSADITTLYGRALQMANRCVDDIIGIVWIGGESDAEAARTRSEVGSAIVAMHDNFKSDLGLPNLPMYYRVMGRYETVNPSYTLGEVRLGQVAAASDSAHRFIAVNGIEDGLLESWHITTDAYDRNGMLIAECIKNQRGITANFGFPTIAISEDTMIVARVIGTDITPESGYTGIVGRTGSDTWIEPESITKSGDTLFLSFGETIYGYRYAYDNDMDTLGLIRDNSSIALPALPFAFNDTAALFSVTATDIGNGTHGFVGDSVSDPGSTVTIYPIPDAGNVFVDYSGDTSGIVLSGDTATFIMSEDRSVTLTFGEIPVIDTIIKIGVRRDYYRPNAARIGDTVNIVPSADVGDSTDLSGAWIGRDTTGTMTITRWVNGSGAADTIIAIVPEGITVNVNYRPVIRSGLGVYSQLHVPVTWREGYILLVKGRP